MSDDGGGTVYLLHLDPPLKHARHYTGWTSNLERRLEAHRAGRGARLMEVVREAGGTFRLARTWPGSRALERAIKDLRSAPEFCPECTAHPRQLTSGRAAAVSTRPEPKPEPGPKPEPELVPEPGQWPALRPGRPSAVAGPEVYDELLPLTDRLISGWLAQPEPPETEPELELLPPPPT